MTFPYKYQRGESPHTKNEECCRQYNNTLQGAYDTTIKMTKSLKLLSEKTYKKGEFCKHIQCEFYPLLMRGDTSSCVYCKAYKLHDYLISNFKPLERK